MENNTVNEAFNPHGSIWHRWDPHIHMPGTQKNNNFTGDDALDKYVKRLNEAVPPIRAIGITDYYVLDSYEKLLEIKNEGKLPNVELLFPNVELRFSVNAAKGSPVNVHLLVCPDDNDHVQQTKRFLANLKFEFNEEEYGCTNDELIRLGHAFNPKAENDQHALRLGVEQSKVTSQNLIKAFKSSKWARDNIMVAIAASQNDGTAQLQDDGLKALRVELQRSSHIIFSGQQKDRAYWSGKGPDSIEVLQETYGGLKPCLHGCDAHDLETVGNPDKDRYCWIKGDLRFETLRQICFEPESRVYIGKEKPTEGRSSDTIESINVTGADWLKTPSLPINSGLVAIIGARGSGKTALAEMIAVGANSVDQKHTDRSFLERAKDLLGNTSSKLLWMSGEDTNSSVHVDDLQMENDDPRTRYLSQQFVDKLCSSDGLENELISEIERVIFEAHHPENRLGSRDFRELREFKTQSVRRRMQKYRDTLTEIGDQMSVQHDLRFNCAELKRKRAIEQAAIERNKKDRNSLTPTDDKTLLVRLEEVRAAAELKSQKLAKLEKKEITLLALKDEAELFRESGSDIELSQLKGQFLDAGLTEQQWELFSLQYHGDVDSLLDEQIKTIQTDIAKHKGPLSDEPEEEADNSKAKPYFDMSKNLDDITHSLLLKEQRRLEACIGVDDVKKRRYMELSAKIVKAETDMAQRDAEIKTAEEAPAKIDGLLIKREASYCSLISEIDNETKVLKELYKPLQDRLDTHSGTLKKLTFSVNREVDIDSWSEAGERLIDKSKSGKFRGIGTLTGIIKENLESVWRNGEANEIAKSMSDFRSNYSKEFWAHAFEDALKNRETKKQWSDQISSWLYSTDHIEVNYGLDYEGVHIQQLSPGTRGIVLLLLYLSIDVDDERPLIIDQPEENLDPSSIYHELVGCFKEAKSRRQIIIVTHNANLVVNTDADQVIIATRGEHKQNALPDISYESGGLENPDIREKVCSILEGGKVAFAERAKRLRLSISS